MELQRAENKVFSLNSKGSEYEVMSAVLKSLVRLEVGPAHRCNVALILVARPFNAVPVGGAHL